MRTDIFWYCEFRQPTVTNHQDPWSKDSKTRHEEFFTEKCFNLSRNSLLVIVRIRKEF